MEVLRAVGQFSLIWLIASTFMTVYGLAVLVMGGLKDDEDMLLAASMAGGLSGLAITIFLYSTVWK